MTFFSRVCRPLAALLLLNSLCAAQQTVYNVHDYGVLGRARHVSDGAMTAGSTELISESANFSTADINQAISVLGAAKQEITGVGSVSGAPLLTTITGVVNARTVTLAAPAVASVAGASVTWGPDDTKAIQTLIEHVQSSGGGTIYFPAGLYRVSSAAFAPALTIRGSNVRLTGASASAAILFNSEIAFNAQKINGVIYSDQRGAPVLYINAGGADAPAAVSNVEVDNLTLEDNGRDYNYAVVGPEGPGVLGTQTWPDGKSSINNFTFRHLVIRTNYLCGINVDSLGSGYSIQGSTIISNGNHLMYLAGAATNGSVTDNTLLGGTVIGTGAPRIGIAVKNSYLTIARNYIDHVQFAGILLGESPNVPVNNVKVENNILADLTPSGTAGIFISWASDAAITGNTVSDSTNPAIMLWTGQSISNVSITRNILAKVPDGISQHQMAPTASITGITTEDNYVQTVSY